ncbi:putative ysc84 actin-binding domain-containing protein [Helianthus anomalus]
MCDNIWWKCTFIDGAGASVAAGAVRRVAGVDFRNGAFVGCSFEGSMVTTHVQETCRFYGNSSIKTFNVLLGSLPRPPAATILYVALSEPYMKVESY